MRTQAGRRVGTLSISILECIDSIAYSRVPGVHNSNRVHNIPLYRYYVMQGATKEGTRVLKTPLACHTKLYHDNRVRLYRYPGWSLSKLQSSIDIDRVLSISIPIASAIASLRCCVLYRYLCISIEPNCVVHRACSMRASVHRTRTLSSWPRAPRLAHYCAPESPHLKRV